MKVGGSTIHAFLEWSVTRRCNYWNKYLHYYYLIKIKNINLSIYNREIKKKWREVKPLTKKKGIINKKCVGPTCMYILNKMLKVDVII